MLEIIRYSEAEHRKGWDEFISRSVNGNFLHSRAFYDHNPANSEDDCSFLFFKKNKIVAVVPACLLHKEDKVVFQSHPRSTFGGFVMGTEIGTVEAVELVGLLIAESKTLGAKEIIVRNPFRILNNRLADETDYAMWYHGFSLLSRELEIAIELQPSVEIIEKRFENGTKYNIKKAEKSVATRLTDDFETFWNMLEKNLSDKHGKKPVHSLADILRLRQLVGEENVLLFGGYTEGKMICGTVVFKFGNRALHAQYIASDFAYQELRAINAVTHYIIKWGHEQGFQYYNLGTANEGGKVINEGLFHFKESFGGRGVLRETMHLILYKNEN
ncbi:MAG TPA: GNAT family N-acetyltransferase [Flavipsychrobacter sp.]|nr:GNAT family N-acetyltransferase [Flavipsychrobacter sp.]